MCVRTCVHVCACVCAWLGGGRKSIVSRMYRAKLSYNTEPMLPTLIEHK